MPGSNEPDGTGLAARATGGAVQAAATAAAAWISYSTSSRLGMQEGYWAAISAIVVMQAELEQTAGSGRDRLLGTAVGGLIAWGCASYWQGRPWIYAAAVAAAVFMCWLFNLTNAGRLAAVAVSVIVLIPRQEPVWRVALFRFLEVAWGVAVAIGVAWATTRTIRFIGRRAAGDIRS